MAPTAAASLPVQKEILAAIQRLSDRMDAQDIAATTAMELRFVNQDELTSLRANKRIDPLATRLDSIDDGLHGVAEQLKALNGTVRAHDKEIGILKVFCEKQVEPALVKVENMRLDIKGLMVQAGGTAAIMAALLAIAKAAGWL